jgi:hypothetical protein
VSNERAKRDLRKDVKAGNVQKKAATKGDFTERTLASYGNKKKAAAQAGAKKRGAK